MAKVHWMVILMALCIAVAAATELNCSRNMACSGEKIICQCLVQKKGPSTPIIFNVSGAIIIPDEKNSVPMNTAHGVNAVLRESTNSHLLAEITVPMSGDVTRDVILMCRDDYFTDVADIKSTVLSLTKPPENFTITVVEVTSNSSILHVNYGISKETDVTIGISSPGVVPNNTTWYYILNNTGYINVSGLRPGHNYTVSASSCDKEFYSTTLATEEYTAPELNSTCYANSSCTDLNMMVSFDNNSNIASFYWNNSCNTSITLKHTTNGTLIDEERIINKNLFNKQNSTISVNATGWTEGFSITYHVDGCEVTYTHVNAGTPSSGTVCCFVMMISVAVGLTLMWIAV